MKDPNIYGLVLAPTFLATFTDKPLVDPATAIQVQTAVSRESRAAVDELAGKALASGGKGPCAAQDLGFMCSRGRRGGHRIRRAHARWTAT